MPSSERTPADAEPSPQLDWLADLELECNGHPVLCLRANRGLPTLDIAGGRGLIALGRFPLKRAVAATNAEALARLATLLPSRIDLCLSGIPIGHYEPAAPQNWLARSAGLPFGCLTVDKLALARAALSGPG